MLPLLLLPPPLPPPPPLLECTHRELRPTLKEDPLEWAAEEFIRLV